MSATSPSLLTARIILGELIETGLRHLVLCPGSRSAPIAYAAAEAEEAGILDVHMCIDERSAAFAALGMAQASGRPAAVATTSGTAVANLLPAVMEAHHTDTPVVILSADRPARLHGTGANQTTNQDVFGAHTRCQLNISSEQSPAQISDQIRAAALCLLGVDASGEQIKAAGPIQLNIGFEEPLIPAADDDSGAEFFAKVTPLSPPKLVPPQQTEVEISLRGLAQRKTVVVAGHQAGPVAEAFARSMGLPLFAEPSSNARFGNNSINAYPALLPTRTFDPEMGELNFPPSDVYHQIERVVVFGRPTLTRQIATLLNEPGLEKALFLPEPVSWFEPGKRGETIIENIQELADFAGFGPAGWLAAWQRAAIKAQQNLDEVAETSHFHKDRISAMRVSQVVWENTRGPLLLGSSNTIREVDMAARPSFYPIARVYANRGLAGIDGTLSTAAGISLATGETVTVLLGDLTFLHDVNAFLQVSGEQRPKLNVVLINDHGGAIFNTLEHALVSGREGMAEKVERLFGTSQHVNIAALCSAYGLVYQYVEDENTLMSALHQVPQGIRVLEVPAQRGELAQRRRDFFVRRQNKDKAKAAARAAQRAEEHGTAAISETGAESIE
ncbi:2-succinyl-5-enolpyruvyl-6-hydroxy-3-cyclohexene-1-carboxylic-acid synthase [Micrococcoides hystricis]|uniref:2-succinyl-5-enolpyruvyl-6-hydroxy-3-cyclohexene-1-carboxylate synthase n=1 Tax=Micrococcoides hystricis TaxID=1572761 RepID=A0ABV6P903_9MICC